MSGFSESPLLTSTHLTPMTFPPFIRCIALGTRVYTCIFRKKVISTSRASLTSLGSSSTPLTSSWAHPAPSANASLASSCLSVARPSCVLRPNMSQPPSSSCSKSFQCLGHWFDLLSRSPPDFSCINAFLVSSIISLSIFNRRISPASLGRLWSATVSQRAALSAPAPLGRL